MVEGPIADFARQLAEEIEAGRRSDGGETYSEHEFTKQMLERLGEDGIVENPTFVAEGDVHFQRRRCRITGFAISEDEDRLLLVTTFFTGEVPPRILTKDEKMAVIKQALNFYECSTKGLHEQIEPSNTDASDLARRIFAARTELTVLRMIMLSDAMTGLDSIDIRPKGKGVRVIVDMYGIERLERIIGAGRTRDDIGIDFVSDYGMGLACLALPEEKGAKYRAFLAAVPGELLADIYEKYGTRLLESNVRAFLGLRGRTSVNAGLRKTIRDAPNDFLAFNNGIVATIEHVDLSPEGESPTCINKLRGLQIVNGGQTTASLHRARRVDKVNLDDILVPAKIIMAREGDRDELDAIVGEISRCANAQNTVQAADFSANDPFHIRVEQLADNEWLPDGSGRYFYERARGSYAASEFKSSFSKQAKKRFASETPKSRRFSKTDLARYLNGWDGHPHMVSFGSQKNFASFMQARKASGASIDELDRDWFRRFIAKAILFRTIQKRVKKGSFPAYQANIAAYVFSLIALRLGNRLKLDDVWLRQSISNELGALVDSWAVVVDQELRSSALSRMPSEWAKKEACWAHMKGIKTLPLALGIPEIEPVAA